MKKWLKWLFPKPVIQKRYILAICVLFIAGEYAWHRHDIILKDAAEYEVLTILADAFVDDDN